MLSRSLTGLALAAGAVVGCRSDRPSDQVAAADTIPATSSIASYTFTATDFAFNGPTQIPAGTATFQLVNRGKEYHHVSVVRLDEGKTFEDLAAAMRQHGPPPSWAHAVGGPNAVDPGGEANATLTLAPGKYVAFCMIPGPDGVPHVAKGMVSHFEVTPAAAPAAPVPAGDVVVTLTDYAFDLSKPLAPGAQTIRVDNKGPQFHELVLARLQPGKTVADFGAWASSGMKTPPPATFIGGVAPIDPKEANSFTVDLTPGDYLLICFLPDAKDGKEHLTHGMIKQVKVG